MYLTKSLQVRSEESAKSELLLLQLMKTAKSLYLTLRIQDLVPTYMEADFNVNYILVPSIMTFIFEQFIKRFRRTK